MAHAYDFYKPNLNSPYPVVDGQLSVQCYASALDTCYTQYCTKSQMNHESHSHTHTTTLTSREVNLSTFAAVVFHTPYAKLVQKSLARLYLNDIIRGCPYIPTSLTEKYKYDLKLNEIFLNKKQNFEFYFELEILIFEH